MFAARNEIRICSNQQQQLHLLEIGFIFNLYRDLSHYFLMYRKIGYVDKKTLAEIILYL